MAVAIRVLHRGAETILERIAPGVFDFDPNERLIKEFLSDARHHLVVAIENDLVVGFVSAVHYVHPDKPTELWINEVSVAPTHQRRGYAKAMLSAMLDVGRQIGCREAWVLTERPNSPAMALYSSLGGRESDAVMFTFKLTENEGIPREET